MGVEGIGIYAFSYSVAQYFVLIAKLGLSNYGAREISKTRNQEEKSEIFSNLFTMQLISTIIVSIFYVIYFFAFVKTNASISIIFFAWILFSFLDIDWFWFGEEEFKRISLRNIIIKLLTILCVFSFIKDSSQVWLYTVIMVVGYITSYIVIWIGLKGKIKFCKPKFSIIKKHLIPCTVMLIPVIALSIYRTMDKVMLGAISGMEETGIYENGEKLIYCLSSLISSLGTVMMPKISYLVEINDKEKIQEYIAKSLKFMMIMTSAMSFGLMAISDNIVPILFGQEFNGSINILFLCSPILIFMGWSNVIRTQYIIPHKFDDIYIKSITFGSILNLIFNFIFIPQYGAIGAVIGTLIAEAFVPFYQYLRLKKKIEYSKYIKETCIYPIIGIIMCIALKMIGTFIETGIVALIVQIALGFFIYIVLTYIYIICQHLKKRKKLSFSYFFLFFI